MVCPSDASFYLYMLILLEYFVAPVHWWKQRKSSAEDSKGEDKVADIFV
jgi:hypothetical protein